MFLRAFLLSPQRRRGVYFYVNTQICTLFTCQNSKIYLRSPVATAPFLTLEVSSPAFELTA